MPAKSKAQLALAHVLKRRGVKWATEMVNAQHGHPAKHLPMHKGEMMKKRKMMMKGM